MSHTNPVIGSTAWGDDLNAALDAIQADADGKVDPGDLAAVATSGVYTDLTGRPTIPDSPDDIGAATSAQGALADSAVQPGDLADVATSGSATDLDSGTLPVTRGGTGLGTLAAGSYLRGNGTGAVILTGSAGVLSDIGADNASNLTSGTVPDARLSGAYSNVSSLSGVGFIVFHRPAGLGNPVISATETGSSFDKLTVISDGTIEWGSGSASPDTNLYRSAANTLKTDDDLIVAGDLTVSGTLNRPTMYAQATGTITLDGTATVVPGATVTFSTTKANQKVLVTGIWDFSVGSGTLSGTADGQIFVDGGQQGPQAFMGIVANAQRNTAAAQVLITLASAGSHTLDLRARRFGTIGTAICNANSVHTTITAQVVD